MLHAYITSYAICFMATVVIIMLLLIAGVRSTRKKRNITAQRLTPPTAKDWIGYILKAFLIAFVVSLAAPLVLIFYIFVIGCIIIQH